MEGAGYTSKAVSTGLRRARSFMCTSEAPGCLEHPLRVPPALLDLVTRPVALEARRLHFLVVAVPGLLLCLTELSHRCSALPQAAEDLGHRG